MPRLRFTLSCLVVLLAVTPLLAQAPLAPDPSCASRQQLSLGIARGGGSYRPLEMEQRLFYPLEGVSGTLEVRYLVRGDLWLSEVIDLANVQLPQKRNDVEKPKDKKPVEAPALNNILRNGFLEFPKLVEPGASRVATAPVAEKDGQLPHPRGSFLQSNRVVELLALNPERVRDLHTMLGEGAAIDVEFYHSGRRADGMPFVDLVARSAALREKVLLPVQAMSEVRGPGIVKKPGFTIRTNDYLPDCGDCTWETSCSTECGYDPGKGGPVTCGEYGVCQSECYPTMYWGEYYTDWYYYGSGYSGWGECFVTEYYPRWHEEIVYVWRRDRIRQTNNCPNAPSCDGCYVTEQVVGYQLTYDSCYARTASYCSPAYMPCCGALCTWFPGIPCSNDWPC